DQRLRRGCSPELGDRPRKQLGRRDLMPAHDGLAMPADDLLRPGDHGGVVVPTERERLVTTYVEVRARGESGDFPENLIEEAVGHLVVDAQRAEADLCAGLTRGQL